MLGFARTLWVLFASRIIDFKLDEYSADARD
jgi:hypothetical protein